MGQLKLMGGGVMIWQVLFSALAAAGLVLVVWCLAGRLLLPARGVLVCCRVRGDAPELEQTMRSLSWLVESGLLRATLRIVDCGLTPEARARAEVLSARRRYIEIVEEECGSTTGTDSRKRRRGCLSE